MENQPKWTAKAALACFLALVGGILLGSLVVGLVLLGMGIDYLSLPFPIALISLPVNETIFVVITLLFAKYKGASLKELGLKKPSVRILMIVSVVAVPLLLLGVGISVGEEMVFGPDPMAELLEKSVMPRGPFQLVAMVALSLVLVGPCEELAFRGFVQRGFENSFGKRWGLLVSSVLFGLLHGLNTPYAVVPVFVVGLVFGYVWQRTGGNTTATALMHGVYDSIAIATAYYLSI
ncbi:CPBP family intramembrane metalloprotease [Candidatus Bathyarchaeota archaeon]|nr:MAG: CPBP family intramembrane metalloprotease [Candidatus Bathyarchaeota archaeon]